MAGTAQADGIGLPVMTIHPAASTSYPKELVNGDFQTFGNRIVDKRSGGWQYLSFVDGNGMAMEGSSEQPWAKVDGWDAVKFGWKSNDSVSGHRGIVEVQRFRTAAKGSTGNVWGEIAAATQGKYLYQDIDTANTSDAMYTVRLKHASRNKDARDSMQVLVGAPGREKPVTMRRTIANAGDKAGEESTTITSTGTGQDDQWDTYEGTVLVPRGQDVTRFTFKSVADSNSAGRPDSAEGNLIDDVVFTKARRLDYDANGGTKAQASQIGYRTGGGTRGKVKTVRDSPAPPAGQEKIVNGDFEYSGTGAGLSDSPFNYVSLSRKSYYYKDSRNVNHRVALPAGFDAKRFAWKSDQTGKDLGNPPYEQAGDVQVWNRYDGSNHYAELTAAQAGSAIYQDIDTESDSDVQYIVSLRHASLNASHLDSMQVLIGAPGHETPVTMTRVTANGHGDKVGESSDTIATRVSNPKPADREDSDHTGQWETYTGTVIVPAGRPVTRFTFRNVSSKSAWNGNLIDDIAFTKAYQLTYDANGGVKTRTSQIDYTTGGGTRGKVETVASKTLPTELVNGSFDYLLDGGWDTISPVGRGGYADDRGWGRFTSVDPASGEYIQNAGQNPATFDSTGKWVKWPGFDAAKFGWASDQKGGQPQGGVGLTDRPNAVELQQDSVTGNTYAEIIGSETGKAILQKIDTQHDSDTVYTMRFDHASLSKEHADSMQALVNGKPVTMTRVTSNKAGDEQGWTGTSITTHATNTNRFQHDGQWATYEGKVTIPANTPVSTFTFKALNAVDPTKGNLIDNLTFKIAYRLSYDANGGAKTNASKISASSNGTVRLAATRTSVPSHALEDTDVPADYRSFTFDTTRTRLADARFDGNWTTTRDEAGKTETAASRMNGTVRLAADRDTEPESGTTTDDRKVLTDTIARQDDGTSQRTITRSDGSVQVQTIADTGAVSGCQVYYPAGAKITLATAKADSDCWDSSQISKTNRTFYGWSANTDANDKDVPVADTMDRATLDANAETQITMPARAKTVYALWAINPTLTYNVNAPATTKAPDAPASMTVPYNTAADDKSGWTVGDTGKITGYSFDGWYTSPTGGDKYDWSTKLTNDATMYAHWTANACTVKYDAGGGQGSMPDQKFTFGVPQNLTRNTFTRSGWAFTGWKRADTGDAYQDGQQVANLICTPNGWAPFVAQWTPNAAAINYNANPPAGRTAGGQGTANWTGHTGDTQAIGANGWTVDGYTFIGWNTSADGKGTAYAPGTTWTANGTLTLYAQWTPGQAGLTYDGNGATGGKTDPQPGKTDEKINVRDNGFTRDGYMFVTWNTQAGCKGKAVDPGDEWTLQGSGTLYACWAGTAQTLAYHGNGATGGNTAVQSGKTGDELITNANGFTRDGYTFVRWDTAKDGSGTAYGEGKNGVSQYTMKPAGNDLYAIWKANPASIVYRNGYPNTTGSTPDTTGSTGDTVTVSQNGFDRPGYTFTGWSTSKRGDPSLNPGDKHTLEPGATTVWAQWKANPAHLVYNSNIGSIGSETRTVDGVVDQTVKTIDNPFDRPGYTFTGWSTQADGKGKAYDPGADCTLTANDKSTPKNTSVLYAQWTINKVTLKFDPNGGVGGYPSINTDAFGSVTIPKDAKEPKVTRPGFRFTGWSLKKTPDKDETLLTPGKDTVSMPAEGEVAVYAQWEPAMTTLPFTGGNAQIPTIWLWAGLAFLIIAAGVFSPMIRLRMGAGSKGRHAGTPTIGRHSR